MSVVRLDFFLAPDPEYYFLKPLQSCQTGYIGRAMVLSCLCAEDAKTVWMKDGTEINEDDEQFSISSLEGENSLKILSPSINNSGRYTCKIVKFGKVGEDETVCDLNIIGKSKYCLIK